MPAVLLPASAAAFAPRGQVNVVLNSRVEPWLTATLKRINKVKRPLNSVPQHQRCLTETLSGATAIWSLCSLLLSKAPEADLRKDDDPLVEALFNHHFLHVEAYIVHVDLVSQNEVAFKLTSETIDLLVEYHKDVFSVDTAAKTWTWADKEQQLKRLQDEFVHAANKFVYRTGALVLEGLEEAGAGELLCGRADEVRQAILNLFVPLLPPPPRVAELIRPTALLPSSTTIADPWWPSQHVHAVQPAPLESWKVVPSSPSPVSSCDSHHTLWSNVSMAEPQLPSPAPSYSPPFSTPAYTTSSYYTAAPAWSTPVTSLAIPSLPLPSMLTPPNCGTTAGIGSCGWDRYPEYGMPYATAM